MMVIGVDHNLDRSVTTQSTDRLSVVFEKFLTLKLFIGDALMFAHRWILPAIAGVAMLFAAATTSAQTFQGTLALGQSTLDDGSFYQTHTVQAQQGQNVTVAMQSAQFDTYLIVLSPSGQKWENDDFGGSTNSQVQFVADQTGEYTILANSFGRGETGAYTITVQGVGAGAQIPLMVRQIRLFTESQSSRPLMTERAIAIDGTRNGLINALGFELGVRLSNYAIAWSHAGPDQSDLVASMWKHSKALAQSADIAISPLPELVLDEGFNANRHATALAYLLNQNTSVEDMANTYGESPASLARLSIMLHFVMWLYHPTDGDLNTEVIRSLRHLRDVNDLPSELLDGLLLAMSELESHDSVKAKALESIQAIIKHLTS